MNICNKPAGEYVLICETQNVTVGYSSGDLFQIHQKNIIFLSISNQENTIEFYFAQFN